MKRVVLEGLGQRLRQAREEMGLSQRAFGDAIGLTRSMIGLVENGAQCPSLDTLYKIALFTGASCDYLLGFAGERAGALSKRLAPADMEELCASLAEIRAAPAGMEELRESLAEIDDILCEALEGKNGAAALRAAIRDAVFYLNDALADIEEMLPAGCTSAKEEAK